MPGEAATRRGARGGLRGNELGLGGPGAGAAGEEWEKGLAAWVSLDVDSGFMRAGG